MHNMVIITICLTHLFRFHLRHLDLTVRLHLLRLIHVLVKTRALPLLRSRLSHHHQLPVVVQSVPIAVRYSPEAFLRPLEQVLASDAGGLGS